MTTLTITKPHNIRKLMRELYLDLTAWDKFSGIVSQGDKLSITLKPGATEDVGPTIAAIVDAHTPQDDAFLVALDKMTKAQQIGANIVAEFGAMNMATSVPREQMVAFASAFMLIQLLLMGGSLGLAKDAIEAIPNPVLPLNVRAYFIRRVTDGIGEANS